MRTIQKYLVAVGIIIATLKTLGGFGPFNPMPTRNLRQQEINNRKDAIIASEELHGDSIQQIRTWRAQYHQKCHNEQQPTNKPELLRSLTEMLELREGDVPPSPEEEVAPCRYTILDLGANVGDSLGKFIDSGVEPCPEKDIPKNPRLNLDTMGFNGNDNKNGDTLMFHEKGNPLVRSSRSILKQVGHYPEEYCYFGIEGNPRFTERLKSLEERIERTHPRPVGSAKFFTETVAAGSDGPTVLYLDTVNGQQNYWGSSILPTHQDVQKSKEKEGAGTTTSAAVNGITLSTLLQKTTQKVHGAHALIKMDIEGGEYAVLEEAYRSGVLCDFSQSGVTIHIILETHRPDVTGDKDFDLEHWRLVKKHFGDCGVVLQTGRDAGR